ncbi:glycosyltransferase [Streptomyces sp. CA-142005]|uniref:glycosyltransferase n=1 Tax=Streptomyces sp. CA-142005 TaxID=3240052 RepID=UPI003D8E1F6D
MLSAGSTRRVVVVQPYVPGYRTSFFNHLHARLDASGVALEVLHGPPPPQHAARRDASSCACAVQVPSRRLTAPGGRSLFWNQVLRRTASADVIVLEQALRNLDAYPLLLRQLAGRTTGRGPRVAFWGHGRTYTKPHSRLETTAKNLVTRLGSWFFAYTKSGATYVAAQGFPRQRITIVRNSVNTVELTTGLARATRPGTPEFAEAELLRERYGLVAGRTALFIGGLDTPKRIPFLLECVDRIAAELPGFRLLVAGEGSDRYLVDQAASQPGSPVVTMGHVDTRRTALLGAVSDVMLMPGRVGLCAVDSFALKTPIVTTDWPWHAPEFEYLEDGRNAVVTRDNVAAYAAAVKALLSDRARLASLRLACSEEATDYTVDGMAARFCDGLLKMLERDA